MPDDEKQRDATPLLRLENVGKIFQMGEVSVEALRDVSLDIAEGEFLVMVGPSGSGKTTLLNIVGGLDSVTSGRVWFRGEEMTSFGGAQLTRYRRDVVGFVFQFYNLVPNLTRVGKRLGLDGIKLRSARRRRIARTGRSGRTERSFSVADVGRRATARLHRPRSGEKSFPHPLRRTDRGVGFRDRQAGFTAPGRFKEPVAKNGHPDHA